MLNLVLFGPPGAGKGTQSQKLIEKYQLVHLSTGDLLREEIANETLQGMEAKEIMRRGELVPDSVVIQMISNSLDRNQAAKGFIFDGFPRTIPQAEALDDLLNRRGLSITTMIALQVDSTELEKRLQGRAQVSGRPDDVDLITIRKRIEEYQRKTASVASYYASQSKYHKIDGMGGVDKVFASICQIIDRLVIAC